MRLPRMQPRLRGYERSVLQSGTRGAGAGGASLTSELAQKHRKVGCRVPGGHLEEHLGDPAAVVSGVVDYVHEDCATAHLAGITSHEAEPHGLTKSRVGLAPELSAFCHMRTMPAPNSIEKIDMNF